jgi:type II secretory ATPase GspE/PulE/Tfp pilus assembly ATPase PilB-like protein
MSRAPHISNPLDAQPDDGQAQLFDPNNRQAPPFANATTAEISEDVEIAVDKLTVVPEIYDDEVLRELAPLLPFDVARDNQSILIKKQNDGSFFVGMCAIQNLVNQVAVARALNISVALIHPRFLNQTRLLKLLEVAYNQSVAYPETPHDHSTGDSEDQESVNWTQFESDAETQLARETSEPELEIGTGTGLRASAGKIILSAIAQRASDIHLVPQSRYGCIKFRIDGDLYESVSKIPPARMENLANAFCDMAGVNGYEVTQHEVARDIIIKLRTRSGHIDRRTLRFQGTPGQHGRIIVIRIQTSEFRDFDQIGIEPNQIAEFDNALHHKNGLILVTGPTGSGKSNTLEAMLRKLEQMHQGRKNVIQLGNPIEFPKDGREQIPLKADDDWERAFKASLRMDPNIVTPGEFRSAAEAAVVFNIASTGHLTLTTVHTNNVAQTFSRLDSLGIDRDRQSAFLKLIVSQELVPLLCPHCKAPDPRGQQIAERLIDVVFPNRHDLKDAISKMDELPFFHRVGCARCNNKGIKLRTCIAEAMTITPDISRMLRNNADGEDIVDHAVRQHGMVTLAEAAARKLCSGTVAYEDVFSLLISPHNAAPETQTYSWKPSNQPTSTPAQEPEDPNNEYIEADIEYTEPETSRAAA